MPTDFPSMPFWCAREANLDRSLDTPTSIRNLPITAKAWIQVSTQVPDKNFFRVEITSWSSGGEDSKCDDQELAAYSRSSGFWSRLRLARRPVDIRHLIELRNICL